MKRPEQDLQKACADLLNAILLPGVLWTAIGHGGGGKTRGAILNGMGVKAGVSDLLIMWSVLREERGINNSWSRQEPRILWIELKSVGGKMTKDQDEWFRAATAIGQSCRTVRSLEELMSVLITYEVPHRKATLVA